MLPLILLFTVISTEAIFYQCPLTDITLIGQVIQDIVDVPPNLKCNVSARYSSNKYAIVEVNAYNMAQGDEIILQGLFDTVRSNGQQNFSFKGVFPAYYFQISIKASAQTTMKLQYSMIAMPVPPVKSFGVNEVSTKVLNSWLQFDKNAEVGVSWMVSAESTISIALAYPHGTNLLNLMNLFVYDSVNITYTSQPIGTLYGLREKLLQTQIKNLTLLYISPVEPSFVATVLFNDQLNLAGCTSYATQWSYGNPVQTVNTPGGPLQIDVTLDATNGPACLTIVNEFNGYKRNPDYTFTPTTPYFKEMILQEGENTQPYVIAGTPMANNNLFPIKYGNLANPTSFSLPQFFDGDVRTIILNSGILQLGTTIDPEQGKEARIGRIGFYSSMYYPYPMMMLGGSQPLALESKDGSNFALTFTITRANLGKDDGFVFVANATGQRISAVDIMDPCNIGKSFTVIGNNLTLYMQSYTTVDTAPGLFLEYKVNDPADAPPPAATDAPCATGVPVTSLTGGNSAGGASSTTQKQKLTVEISILLAAVIPLIRAF